MNVTSNHFHYLFIFLAIILLGFCPKNANAQAPQRFSFQGVARKADGKPAATTSVSLRVSIHTESIAGTIVYQETHNTQTNAEGIFNISIGGGTVTSGDFTGILWKASAQFLQLELDPGGGNNYVDLGTTQLLSVPYSMHAKEAEHWVNGYPVIQKSDQVPVGDPNMPKYYLPQVGAGARLIWYPFKAAFRAGLNGNGTWEDAQIGQSSVAFGIDNLASGEGSASFGSNSQATGVNSFAMGKQVVASGWESSALGSHTIAKARGSFVAGTYNENRDSPDIGVPDPSDRIFQIGNGDQNVRKNALTILRGGNVGIGSTALSPGYLLDVGGRARIRHNGATAGIHFNNSTNGVAGFVGMVNDHKIGFYVGNQWMFQVADNGAIASGNVAIPLGVSSVSLGTETASIGDGSVALGAGTVAKGFGATVVGAYNNLQDNNTVGSQAGAKSSDRVFQIGNGLGPQSLSNALTVLRNGYVGIGNNALYPTHILEVGGRPRIHHSASTAGIYFDNSQHLVDGFVGMKTDDQVGFYLGNSWKFWVDNAGNGYLNGVIVQTSDRRRKRDFKQLSASLSKIIDLKGYHFHWNDKRQDPSLQTGLIAQEVETLFPELVKTDDKGYKAVNYIGLIPHLVESVKELAKENAVLKSENADSKIENSG
ncbi:tail fiber domain-containing protein [Dyadobacter sp. CY261]|uniref:tail fiber domain-containing protein n=1 Tax=Dyadobacter sp. CY261 TaxID=2907203 RepID=UPI001F36DB71|nr:tail fiber domain-containing protein [Dyadobacter sp. CY261]MCF0071391.1 tail fiber domain-containing protein [Dyadobacter sp. CY261]